MDLVKSYDSNDDSTDEEIQIIPVSPKMKKVDLINLDSDTEDESTVEKEKATEIKTTPANVSAPEIECMILDSPAKKELSDLNSQVKETCKGLDTLAKKTLKELNSQMKETCIISDSPSLKNTHSDSQMKEMCIDLESSGKKRRISDLCDDLDEKRSAVRLSSKVDVIPPSNPAKTIDYLCLDESESENESENIEKTINNLKETASILTEAPCGPEKPANTSNTLESLIEDVSSTKQGYKTVLSNSKADSNSARSTPDSVQNSTSCDSAEHSNLVSNVVFREDTRLIEACDKIILNHIPRQVVRTHNAHNKMITSLNWCIPKHSYLFLSASHDGSVKVWDLYRSKSVRCLQEKHGLNAAKWSHNGGQIYAGGFGKKAYVYDVETAQKIVQYDVYNIVTSLECHPYVKDIFLVGTRNAILGFDLRVATPYPIRIFLSQCQEVLDITFLDENEFACSANIVTHDSADRTIMVWEFGTGAKLSNQIYLERFTCPSLKFNKSDATFIAQTNGNYIASFSSRRPYKMKQKRYDGHKVSGYGIDCDISPDGKYVVSGDAEGSLYYYDYCTTKTIFVTPKQKIPTNKVKWHPILSSTLISSTYDGQIQVWK